MLFLADCNHKITFKLFCILNICRFCMASNLQKDSLCRKRLWSIWNAFIWEGKQFKIGDWNISQCNLLLQVQVINLVKVQPARMTRRKTKLALLWLPDVNMIHANNETEQSHRLRKIQDRRDVSGDGCCVTLRWNNNEISYGQNIARRKYRLSRWLPSFEKATTFWLAAMITYFILSH